jgi:ADP-ribosylglycohydrolase
MDSTHAARLARALTSLEGLSVGDALGERYFTHRQALANMHVADTVSDLNHLRIPRPPWAWTDDTAMAIAIVETLRDRQGIDQDHLAQKFSKHYVAEPRRGYGPAMHDLLPQLHRLGAWKTETRTLFGGQGSFGNGSAMRVSPVGAYFADNLPEAIEHAARSAVVTHTHPEAVAGAIAMTVATALAAQAQSSTKPNAQDFLDAVIQHTPPSEVSLFLSKARDLPQNTKVHKAVDVLGSGQRITAQDTAPFVIWLAAWNLDDYERAICHAISGRGDVDTTCAMVGGIVVMYTGVDAIPTVWREGREPLPTL